MVTSCPTVTSGEVNDGTAVAHSGSVPGVMVHPSSPFSNELISPAEAELVRLIIPKMRTKNILILFMITSGSYVQLEKESLKIAVAPLKKQNNRSS
jgi:hypothetical protein